ncbi:MAG: protein phosphatase [Pseudohongiellaceae bacterium]|jgi:protein phosphatase
MSALATAINSSSMTHTGSVRSHNEDAFLSMPEAGLWAVADGMGGHEAGDYASLCIIDYLRQACLQYQGQQLVEQVPLTLQKANAELCRYAQQLPAGSIVGSTVVVLVLEADRFHCFWSGDSRCYLLRDQQLTTITRDHTEAQDLLAKGLLSAEQAANDPALQHLTEAIGIDVPAFIDYQHDVIYEGDRFLLCSDGINKVFSDPVLAERMLGTSINHINQQLLSHALQVGAPDNLSSIIVSLDE